MLDADTPQTIAEASVALGFARTLQYSGYGSPDIGYLSPGVGIGVRRRFVSGYSDIHWSVGASGFLQHIWFGREGQESLRAFPVIALGDIELLIGSTFPRAGPRIGVGWGWTGWESEPLRAGSKKVADGLSLDIGLSVEACRVPRLLSALGVQAINGTDGRFITIYLALRWLVG